MNLRDTQSLFMDYLLAANTESESASLGDKSAGLAALIAAQGGIDVDKRMGIYSNAYRVRLVETIDTDHEILGLYLGDDLFEKMVGDYIAANPSSFHSLRLFCDALPAFLHNDDFFGQYPILADIANFERRLLNAFDAQESARATFSDLQAIEPQLWPGIQFRFHPSLQIFRCDSNAVESWQALKQDQTPPSPDYSGQRAWMLWRGPSRVSEFISLAPYQLALVEGFLQGNNFAGQCEQMLQWFDQEQATTEVLQAVQAWFVVGIISSIITS
ncbi:MAG: DNA-binding domain-containing protein [Halioglobus sp.]